MLVYHGRVHHQEPLFTARGPAPLHHLELFGREVLGELSRVSDRGGRANEHGIRAVVTTHTPEPSQHIRQMTPKHTSIGVELIDHHKPQVLEQLGPPRMVRQDPGVEHLGVAEHDLSAPPNNATSVLRRVAIVGEGADVLSVRPQSVGQAVKLRQLVLGESLGGKQIQRTRGGLGQDGRQDGHVVAERLPRRGRGDHHCVSPGEGVVDRF